MSEDWPEHIEETDDEEEALRWQIAVAEVNLAALKFSLSLKRMADAFCRFSETVSLQRDDHILSQPLIGDPAQE